MPMSVRLRPPRLDLVAEQRSRRSRSGSCRGRCTNPCRASKSPRAERSVSERSQVVGRSATGPTRSGGRPRPSCRAGSTAVNAAPGSSQPRNDGMMRRCAVDEIGRNSVSPWTIPRTMAWNASTVRHGNREHLGPWASRLWRLRAVARVTGHADVAQLVEHHLAKVRVAGSNPVVRSKLRRSAVSSGAAVACPTPIANDLANGVRA